ncbi:MAG: sigma-54 dependent transcriptional regulator [bacterium]
MSWSVLIVDDESDVRRGLQLILGKKNFDVKGAASSEEALELLRHSHFDFVITDIKMGGMHGIELLKKVKEKWPRTEVIVITGFGTIETAVEAMRLGAYHYITKPFNNDEVTLTLQRAAHEQELENELDRLRSQVQGPQGFHKIIGRDRQMLEIFSLIERVAPTNVPVLIQGESGTGKELIARAIHMQSSQVQDKFIAVNSAAFPDTLLESELFGSRKGAFTGADQDRKGLFLEASGGTLFLDDISNMSEAFQAKLLRVLQEGEILPLGQTQPLKVDVRILAAANRDLADEVKSGKFREDLYYRIHVVPIRVPPLRERQGDIPLIASHILKRFCTAQGLPCKRIMPDAMRIITAYPWPGNVRELENTLHRAALISEGEEIRQGDMVVSDEEKRFGGLVSRFYSLPYDEAKERILELFQKEYVQNILSECSGNISRASEKCGLTRAAMHRIIKKHGLSFKGDELF